SRLEPALQPLRPGVRLAITRRPKLTVQLWLLPEKSGAVCGLCQRQEPYSPNVSEVFAESCQQSTIESSEDKLKRRGPAASVKPGGAAAIAEMHFYKGV